MATINLGAPFNMTDALLTLGEDDYQKGVSTARISFTPNSSEFLAISGDTYGFTGKGSFALNLTFAQDWETTDSLCLYLWENAGTKVEITLEPVAGGAGFTGTVTLVEPDAAGGDVNTPSVASAVLPFDGKPTLVPAA